ncbi:MAG: nucleoside monophosphate kinase [Chitinophagaceae bacterium]|nr:nucleoside monophosphate kinase [Chitinophagaceae bacterium]
MEILIITGPPYSGKGTQCEILKTKLGFIHISTGDRICKEKDEKTSIGKVMMEYEENGNLVPDHIMQKLIGKIIDENSGAKGIILDGYPRTKSQVDTILNLLSEKKLSIIAVINIDVPREELLLRAQKRAGDSNRKDDLNSDIHLKRIEIFENTTRPAIAYMKAKFKVFDINGLGTIETITATIAEALHASQ